MGSAGDDDPANRRRWPWVLAFLALTAIGAYVALLGLAAPWTGAPQIVTLALFLGGCSLAVIGLLGVSTAAAGDGGRPWLGRWLCLAVAVALIATVGYLIGDT